MNAKNIDLTPGTALVIVGPSGSGKSTFAAEIASRYGKYIVSVFSPRRGAANIPLTLDGIKTVIVKEMPSVKELEEFKPLISNGEIAIQTSWRMAPIKRIAPNFIFCTGDVNATEALSGDRRFRVIELSEVDGLKARITHLEGVIRRMREHSKLALTELNDIASEFSTDDGYDTELEEIE